MGFIYSSLLSYLVNYEHGDRSGCRLFFRLLLPPDTFAFQYSILHTSLPNETFGDFKAGSSAAVHLNLEKR
ncbi:hypothetical protein [Paenibacillus peoriae]|uniref:hypothetical protein n=1 Tax=Paenibacillus peoriae TaxID=59893 RepID=UPI00215AF4D3|nr:hypothetical protein [Paenibacillus peoriae]